MWSGLVTCCLYLLTLLTNLSTEANSVDSVQTDRIGAVWTGSTLFVKDTSKSFHQQTKPATFIVFGISRVNMEKSCGWKMLLLISQLALLEASWDGSTVLSKCSDFIKENANSEHMMGWKRYFLLVPCGTHLTVTGLEHYILHYSYFVPQTIILTKSRSPNSPSFHDHVYK